jgi:hypothetical protein
VSGHRLLSESQLAGAVGLMTCQTADVLALEAGCTPRQAAQARVEGHDLVSEASGVLGYRRRASGDTNGAIDSAVWSGEAKPSSMAA